MDCLPPPGNFDGNRRKFKSYWTDIQWRLDTFGGDMDDSQKIAWILSLLRTNKGPVETWCQFYYSCIKDKESGLRNYGTFAEFSKKLEDRFMPTFFDKLGALLDLSKIQQGKSTAQSHVLAFQQLVREAEIEPESDTDESRHLILIFYFGNSIHPVLLDKVLSAISSMDAPKRIEYWYEKAIRIDSNYRRLRSSLRGHDSGSEGAKNTTTMSAQERSNLRKQGDCFKCKEHGHIAKYCPNRREL